MNDRSALTKFDESKRAFQRILDTTTRQRNNKGEWVTDLPGFKYDDFNRAGLLNIVKLDRLSQTSRRLGKFGELTNFMFGHRWTFSPQLYDRAAIDFPMELCDSVCGIGRSSTDLLQRYVDAATGNSLATFVYRTVNVDPVTRESAALPQEVVDELSADLVPGGDRLPIFRPPSKIPERSVFDCRIQVRYDDMDFLFHTNVSSYLGFALECAAQAAESGFYSAIGGDVAFYRAKSETSVYMGESHAGDELTVSTWEDDDNKLVLNFAVQKQSKIICFVQIEFYDQTEFPISRL